MSMALCGQDNAYAERINRTIKRNIWIIEIQRLDQLKKCLEKAVNHYNNKRPHNNIGKLTPMEFENKWFNDISFLNRFNYF